MAAVNCNLVENSILSPLVWIDGDDSIWFISLFMVSLTIVMHISATIANLSIRTIDANKICHLFYIVMIFFIPISKEIKDSLYLYYTKDALSYKKLLSNLELIFTSFTNSSIYNADMIAIILAYIDQDLFVFIT